MNFKVFILIPSLLITYSSSFAQIDIQQYFKREEVFMLHGMEIHKFCDSMPRPEYDTRYYINSILRYPLEALAEGIEQTIYVRVIIDTRGVIWHATALDTPGLNKYLIAEAERVIGAMPPWRPAMLNGKKINCVNTSKVTFFIRPDKKKIMMKKAKKELKRRKKRNAGREGLYQVY